MRFGKIAIKILITAVLVIGVMIIFEPGWGNPLTTLAGLFVILSFPASLIIGIIGIIYDKQKLPAIIGTIIAGGITFFYLYRDFRR